MTVTVPEVGAWPAPAMPDLVEQSVGALRLVLAPRPHAGIVEIRLVVPLWRETAMPPALRAVLPAVVTDAGGEQRWARIGGGIAARGSAAVLIVGAYALPGFLTETMSLLAAAVRPDHTPVDQVQAAIAAAAADAALARADGGRSLDAAVRAALLADSPIARTVPTDDELAAIDPAAVADAVRRHLGPDGSTLIVAGPVEPAEAAEAATAAFGEWSGPGVRMPPPTHRRPGGTVLLHRPGAVQATIGLAGPAPRRVEPGYAALALAVRVVGGTATSRISERLRERRGYAYFANTLLEHERGFSRVLTRTAVATTVTAAAVNELRYELGRAATTDFAPGDLAAGARGLAGRLAVDVHTAAGLAEHLATMAADDVWLDAQMRVATAVRDVTADAARAAAADFLAPARLLTIVVGDADTVGPALESLGEVRVVST